MLTSSPANFSSSRIKLILTLAALVALVLVGLDYDNDRGHDRQLHANSRAPIANPPVDPNRPDLFEEPTIDE